MKEFLKDLKRSYIIHHGGQPVYEEDSLHRYEIIGHYRWN